MGDATTTSNFFLEISEAQRFTVLEVIGKGSYGVVCSAIDNTTGARPAVQSPGPGREQSATAADTGVQAPK